MLEDFGLTSGFLDIQESQRHTGVCTINGIFANAFFGSLYPPGSKSYDEMC